jgi:hypothetical protein
MQYSGGSFAVDHCLVHLDIQALKLETIQIGLRRTKWLFSRKRYVHKYSCISGIFRKMAVHALVGPNISFNFIEIGLTAHTDLTLWYLFPR